MSVWGKSILAFYISQISQNHSLRKKQYNAMNALGMIEWLTCSRNLQLEKIENVHNMDRMQLFKISSLEYLAQSCVRTEQAEEIVLLDSFLHKLNEISYTHRELNNLQQGDQLYASWSQRSWLQCARICICRWHQSWNNIMMTPFPNSQK
jgi:hypothetical protein